MSLSTDPPLLLQKNECQTETLAFFIRIREQRPSPGHDVAPLRKNRAWLSRILPSPPPPNPFDRRSTVMNGNIDPPRGGHECPDSKNHLSRIHAPRHKGNDGVTVLQSLLSFNSASLRELGAGRTRIQSTHSALGECARLEGRVKVRHPPIRNTKPRKKGGHRHDEQRATR
jgi:hypothetical protein